MDAEDLPIDRPLTEDEVAIFVAQAIVDDRQHPGRGIPFQPSTPVLLARLGVGAPGDRERVQAFYDINREPDLDFRMAEFCWRLVGLGYLVPRVNSDYGTFLATARGREFLAGLDVALVTRGGLDQKLAACGLAEHDPARLYARLAQECFLAGHYPGAMVMLGVAAESVVVGLSATLEAKRPLFEPNAPSAPQTFSGRAHLVWITDTIEKYRRPLRRALDGAGATTDWLEPLVDTLNGAGQAIRMTRNDSGHPNGIQVDQADALQLLTLYPRLIEASQEADAALARL